MPDEWPQVAVADLITQGVLFIGDGYRAKNEELGASGLPFARVANIGAAGVLNLRDADRFPEKDLHKVGNKISQPGDIAFTSKGTVGRFIFVKEETERFVYSPQVSFWRVLNQTTIWPRFLLFWMQGREFQEQVDGLKGQTDMADYVSLGDQRRMKITLPPFPIQRRIAEILGRLDDKIEVNRRINRTLEATAQALYRHWFVEFGPFRDGEFVESELGAIPKGWRVGRVQDLGDVVTGKTPSTKDTGNFGTATPFITIPDMHGQVFITTTSRYLSKQGADSQSSKYLPAYSVAVSCIATPGLVCLTSEPSQSNQQINSIVPTERIDAEYIYCSMNMLADQIRLLGSAGSAVLNLNKQDFSNIPILLPAEGAVQQFHRQVAPWFSRILISQQDSEALEKVRDYLLPKLLVGEVKVEAAAEMAS